MERKVIVSTIIILVLFVVAGFLGWQYSLLPKEETPPLEEVPLEEKVKEETVNWKTYKDDEYKYEIKYPKKWSAKEWAASNSSFPWLLSEIGFGNNVQYGDYQISIEVHEKTLDQEKRTLEFTMPEAKPEEVIIGGQDAVKYTGSFGERKAFFKVIYILVPYDNKTYILGYSEANERTDRLKIFNQMSATFRFLQ